MNAQERVLKCIHFQAVDMAPLEYHPCLRGLYEHGEALRTMLKAIPSDFEDFTNAPIPRPMPEEMDADGRYHAFTTDEWGVTWEKRVFQMVGHPYHTPIRTMEEIPSYRLPPHPFDNLKAQKELAEHVQSIHDMQRYSKLGWISLFEKMHALCPFEEVLMGLYEDEPHLNDLADQLVEYRENEIRALLDAGVMGIQFGDDFGANAAMLISPECWRSFFKPRYQRLIRPIREAGAQVFFHTCGHSSEIWPDLKEIGVDAIWPQLSVYSLHNMAARLRELRLACAIHIDRAGVMTRGTPQDVRDAVTDAAKAFRIHQGGAWFYVETDNNFPLNNIRTLLEQIAIERKA